MAAKGSRVRFLVLVVFGIIAVAAVALMMRPGPAPIVTDEIPRFELSSATARAAIAANWNGPVASGSGTRCWEARDGDRIWRACDAPSGELMTLSVSTPTFDRAAARALASVLHANDAARTASSLDALETANEVTFCTVAGPLWRSNVDGRVVVGSVGRCPLT